MQTTTMESRPAPADQTAPAGQQERGLITGRLSRRAFLTSLTGTALLTAAGLSSPLTAEGKKSLKILVLTGSPRIKGNTAMMADAFIQGAEEAGHHVVRFDAGRKNVHPCVACNACGMDGPCQFSDDFSFVREHIIDADLVAFVSPVYYYTISAQLKAVIDRFYAINEKIHVSKKAVFLAAMANTSRKQAQPLLDWYGVLLDYLGWTDSGHCIAYGMWPAGAIEGSSYLDQVRALGRSVC